ncbi:LysB family phage lysis regulatory protein [Yersinia ruckeri]
MREALFRVLFVWALAAGFYGYSLYQEVKQARQQVTTLSGELSVRDNLITRLQAKSQQQAQNELALRQSLRKASDVSLSREQKIQRLLNENKALRDWFATALPADIIRLHQRPAFASPNDYLRWLSDGQQLPTPSQHSSG